ncbi:MAG: hypothetical protein C0483_21430 [Pirellula sp.]|nr:hypothetical protein [Pirellula sp.]
MSKYRVIVLPRAQEDAQRIFNWLREHSEQGAATWLAEFFSSTDVLENSPESWSVADESPHKGHVIRQLIFRTPHGRPYRMLFRVEQQVVHVMHVRGPGQPPI